MNSKDVLEVLLDVIFLWFSYIAQTNGGRNYKVEGSTTPPHVIQNVRLLFGKV